MNGSAWHGRVGCGLAATLCLFSAVGMTAGDTSAHDRPPGPEPVLLSAFFGLDNALPFTANGLCRGAAGQDGMPVVFATEVVPDTVQPEDFAVVTASGEVRTPACATLRPAVDAGELRTVLLIGEFGDAETDPPVRVEVVGDITAANETGRTYRGESVEVTPLSAGPAMVAAESLPPDEWRLGQRSGPQRGDGCPSDGTRQAVLVTWAGGITNAAGDDPGEAERALYEVTVHRQDGGEETVAPFAVADLGDGDNNHLLCLDAAGVPLSVFYPAGHLYDPNHDAPNPDTRVAVGPRSRPAGPVDADG